MKSSRYNNVIDGIKTHLKNKGWDIDRWGNAKTNKNGKVYRMKFNAISCRYEVKYSGGWVRLRTIYYKNVKKEIFA